MQVAMEEALTVNFTKRKHLRKEQQIKRLKYYDYTATSQGSKDC